MTNPERNNILITFQFQLNENQNENKNVSETETEGQNVRRSPVISDDSTTFGGNNLDFTQRTRIPSSWITSTTTTTPRSTSTRAPLRTTTPNPRTTPRISTVRAPLPPSSSQPQPVN